MVLFYERLRLLGVFVFEIFPSQNQCPSNLHNNKTPDGAAKSGLWAHFLTCLSLGCTLLFQPA